MRKVAFFALLLVIFLAALVIDQNVRQEAKIARSGAAPPELSSGDILEVTIGYPSGRQPREPVARQAVFSPRTPEEPPAPEVRPAPKQGAAAPAPAAVEPRGPERRLYTVKPGDTLTSIARDLLGDESKVDLLQEWNALPNPNLIRPGQELVYFK